MYVNGELLGLGFVVDEKANLPDFRGETGLLEEAEKNFLEDFLVDEFAEGNCDDYRVLE